MSPKKPAAFFDLDGTLVKTNLVHSYLFTAWNEPSVARTFLRTLGGIARIPAFWAVDQLDRLTFNEMLFAQYEGLYEDRLLEFADEHFEKVLKPNIFDGAMDLVEAGKKKGLRQVIVSGNLDIMVRPLAKYFGFDDLITNRLEIKRGRATGNLVPPILAGANKARFIQEYAEKYDIDLLASFGYSDSYSDYPMLAVLGRPTAVNPDWRLRRAARSFQWPVLNLGSRTSSPSQAH